MTQKVVPIPNFNLILSSFCESLKFLKFHLLLINVLMLQRKSFPKDFAGSLQEESPRPLMCTVWWCLNVYSWCLPLFHSQHVLSKKFMLGNMFLLQIPSSKCEQTFTLYKTFPLLRINFWNGGKYEHFSCVFVCLTLHQWCTKRNRFNSMLLFLSLFLFAEKNFDHDLLDHNRSDFNNFPINMVHNTLN